ncbi:MAG: hypothetical protein ACYDHZ_10680 [Dehalococcoidia bacterium]
MQKSGKGTDYEVSIATVMNLLAIGQQRTEAIHASEEANEQ